MTLIIFILYLFYFLGTLNIFINASLTFHELLIQINIYLYLLIYHSVIIRNTFLRSLVIIITNIITTNYARNNTIFETRSNKCINIDLISILYY